MKKLFLFDAMALIYRAHFAFAKTPRINSKGMNTSAVFGFTNTILEVIKKEKPDYLGVAFDTPVKTFRHIEFPDYKAQRDEQPEDITVAIPYVKKMVEALDIPLLILDGYEADDVIGTIAKKAVRANPEIEVYMMTPDKDYGQLVEERIKMYKPAFMGKGVEILGVKEVCEKWKIKDVDQVVDILGLMGDAVDNIPGIPGVGEKTAQKLIEEYGSIENLLENTQDLKGKLKEKVEENKEKGIMSKWLARIKIDVPVDYEEDKLVYTPPIKEKIEPLLDELEFRTLKKRILGEDEENNARIEDVKTKTGQMDLFSSGSENGEEEIEESISEIKNLSNTQHNYHLIRGENACKGLMNYLLRQEIVCFDTETTNLNAIDAELVGVSFSYRSGEGFYVPFPENQQEANSLIEIFKPFFEAENIIKVAQNIKYDMNVLANYGIEVKGKIYDTMLAHYLLEPDKRHNMDALSYAYLQYEPLSIEKLIGKKGANQGNMREVELDLIKEYATEDADITLQLKEPLDRELNKIPKLLELLENVEMPLTRVLSKVESEGVNIDVNFLNAMSLELEKDAKLIEQKVYEIAG
ncbi:MAG: DNA-directed polymerase, partial [Bacteroidota bacterium]